MVTQQGVSHKWWFRFKLGIFTVLKAAFLSVDEFCDSFFLCVSKKLLTCTFGCLVLKSLKKQQKDAKNYQNIKKTELLKIRKRKISWQT